MYLLTSLSSLHLWACHWKRSGISNIFSSLPQPVTALPYQSLVTSNSSWSCMGRNAALCREDQSVSSYSPICFGVGREGQSWTFCLSYQLWLRSDLKFTLLICYFFYMTAEFLSILAIQFFHRTAWRWKTSFSEKPFESCSSGVIWRKRKGKTLHICTQMKRRNWWGCRMELETFHQCTLKWLYLLNSTRGNQHTVVTGKIGKS